MDFDLEKWKRKVFKVYKGLLKTEKQCDKLPTEQQLASKRMMKLVVVLFHLHSGMSTQDVRTKIKLDQAFAKTDSVCKETASEHSKLPLSLSSFSFDEASLISTGEVVSKTSASSRHKKQAEGGGRASHQLKQFETSLESLRNPVNSLKLVSPLSSG